MNACQRNDTLLRKMIEEGCSLAAIGRAVGTNHTRVKEHILRNQIPHKPFVAWRLGEKNGRWKGGRIIDKDGYVLLKRRDHPNCNRHGYVREHRLVMEKHLGRLLTRKEVVHHKDKKRENNTIENLGLYEKNSDHLAVELNGKVPNWTEDGLRRMKAGIRKSAKNRRSANQKK